MTTIAHFSGSLFQVAHQVRRHYSLRTLWHFGRNSVRSFRHKPVTEQTQDLILVWFIFFPVWAMWFVFGPFQS